MSNTRPHKIVREVADYECASGVRRAASFRIWPRNEKRVRSQDEKGCWVRFGPFAINLRCPLRVACWHSAPAALAHG